MKPQTILSKQNALKTIQKLISEWKLYMANIFVKKNHVEKNEKLLMKSYDLHKLICFFKSLNFS